MLWRISFHMSETSKKFNYPEHSKKLKKKKMTGSLKRSLQKPHDGTIKMLLRKFRMNLYRETAVGALGLLHLKKNQDKFQ